MWAALNNCEPKPQRTTVAPSAKGGKKTQVDTYRCAQDTKVVLYSVKDGGNTWPGGQPFLAANQVGRTSSDLEASEAIWSFLQPYRLPAATPAN
jgi:polyhydroxybutyrate depolymerase